LVGAGVVVSSADDVGGGSSVVVDSDVAPGVVVRDEALTSFRQYPAWQRQPDRPELRRSASSRGIYIYIYIYVCMYVCMYGIGGVGPSVTERTGRVISGESGKRRAGHQPVIGAFLPLSHPPMFRDGGR
jgi:hypothetical protein